jgi:alpha-D-ribose 1-methylphosphonate 5-triphosphate diphosphatase
VAEFPTTLEAAAALNQAGIAVMMGAPNLVRGGSHSGNVAASTLAGAGLLDVFSSDYVPSSLLMAALRLPAAVPASTSRAPCALSRRRPPRRWGSATVARSSQAGAPT